MFEKLNILDINYSKTYFQKEKSGRHLVHKILDILLFTLKELIKDVITIFKNKSLREKVILFFTSSNQYNSLKPLETNINNFLWISSYNSKGNNLPKAIGCLISLFLAPHFIYKLFTKYREKREVIIESLDSYFFINGMIVWWFLYLNLSKPNAIIMSNDHLVWHRALRIAAQKNAIPVIYLQHASVTRKFPKLEFDLSLLEGQDAFNKYKEKGIDGKVSLVGMIKFDDYYPFISYHNNINTIGISTNILDNKNSIEALVSLIREKFPKKSIIIRPHPQNNDEMFYRNLSNKFNVAFSDSKFENSFEYLKKVDLNIACESSIHLEAVLMNVYPIYYQLTDEMKDHYGYLNNGLVPDVFKGVKPLVKRVKELTNCKPNIRSLAEYYVETVNSEYDGRAVE
jgi:hypothetical protein